MGKPFTTALHVMRRMVESDKSWSWFCRIQGPGGEFRLVRDVVDRELDGVWWQRCPLGVEVPKLDQSGSSTQFTVTVPNVNRIVSSYVEIMGEPLGRELQITIVNETETALDLNRVIAGMIVRASVTYKQATFVVGHNVDGRLTPGPLFTRSRFRSLLPTGGIRR